MTDLLLARQSHLPPRTAGMAHSSSWPSDGKQPLIAPPHQPPPGAKEPHESTPLYPKR